ncbi:MAG: Uma2 family endonuclease [Deltaproteobacteria bacterium]|nr:Uma2 family endonuclease [Deltaproteobacteria bacterium]
MVSRFHDFQVDPDDPRAPSQAEWDAMDAQARARVVDSLPSDFPLAGPPEGEPHFDAKVDARDVLRRFFRRAGRRIYVANEIPIYYPGERMFACDLIAVLDVEDRVRERWAVSAEGKGIDFAMEIHYSGSKDKDYVRNAAWFARLGIREYFLFDRRRLSLRGQRLPAEGNVYRPILPQAGRYTSEVLGLDVALEGSRLRFFHSLAALPDATELIGRLEDLLTGALARADEEARRAEEEARRAEEETRRAEEETRRAEDAERQVAALQAELERLKGR